MCAMTPVTLLNCHVKVTLPLLLGQKIYGLTDLYSKLSSKYLNSLSI